MYSKVMVNIKGLVQGVGFRYFCYKKALEYDIKGYAKNLYDGSVEVAATGEKEMVKDFVKELRIGPMYSQVKSVSVEELTTDKTFKDFKMI